VRTKIATLYRIVHSDPPTQHDFMPGKALGRSAPRGVDARAAAAWAEGLSMFDTVERARATAMAFPQIGGFIAELEISAIDADVRYEKSFGPGHFTVYATPDVLLRHVKSVQSA